MRRITDVLPDAVQGLRMVLESGSRLGSYEIVALLGSGGMGEVYRARDTRLDREVAVKVLPADVASQSDRLARFEREAKTVAALNHPNIVTLHSIEGADGLRFLTMEFVEGQTLDHLIVPGGLAATRVLDLAVPLANALAAAHEKGVVHRDLKPANIMLTKDGRLKVLDFGLAKLTLADSDAVPQGVTVESPLSSAGLLLGTVPYMSPEQVRGASVDARTDVFALGAVLYELLTGRRPFDGVSTADVMSAILHRDPVPVGELSPNVPAPLVRLVRRCLVKDPERRIQSSKELRNELEDLQQEMATGAPAEDRCEVILRQPVERQFVLTSAHVRQLSARNPRLIGHPLYFLDNQVSSDTLVLLLHAMGGDHRWFQRSVGTLPYRAVSVSLAGFAERDTYRPVLGIDDHSQILRVLFQELVRECQPRTTLVVGHSAGADQLLRMIASDAGAGIEIAGLLALGPNVSVETLFVSRRYAELDSGDSEAILKLLKSISEDTRGLPIWLAVQSYVGQTFTKFVSDLKPLTRYAADTVAPFLDGGDPLPGWYRSTREKVPAVRFVFSNEEAGPAEALLARHLDTNDLGDRFTDSSFIIEPVHHIALLEPDLIARHLEGVLGELTGRTASSHEGRRS